MILNGRDDGLPDVMILNGRDDGLPDVMILHYMGGIMASLM